MTVFEQLQFNPKNPRKISSRDLERLVESIRNFPEMLEKRPIVYDEQMVVLGGNMRLKALHELVKSGFELKDSFFQSAQGWSEEKKREFVIKDNISNGEWDTAILRSDWSDLPLKDWGIDAKGWEKEVKQDVPPALAAEAISKLGEIYQLGQHRLMCGDATNLDQVQTLMAGVKADMIFTDPPYNVDYDGYTDNKLKIENDKMAVDEFKKLLIDSFSNMGEASKVGASAYICHSSSQQIVFEQMLTEAGYVVRNQIIWAKNTFAWGRGRYKYQHEPIFYCYKRKASDEWYGDHSQSTLWEVPKPSANKEHPTMKPIALIEIAVKNSSKEGDIILDLFAGSGSTLITAHQTNRTCYTMELDPRYCDVIRKRYANLTGKGDGWEAATPKI